MGYTALETDGHGWPSLRAAVMHGNRDVVVALLAEGANVDAVTGNRQTPWLRAMDFADVEVVTALLAGGVTVNRANMTALRVVARFGYVDMVAALLTSGAGVNAVDPSGGTALSISTFVGHPEVAAAFLAAGAALDLH